MPSVKTIQGIKKNGQEGELFQVYRDDGSLYRTCQNYKEMQAAYNRASFLDSQERAVAAQEAKDAERAQEAEQKANEEQNKKEEEAQDANIKESDEDEEPLEERPLQEPINFTDPYVLHDPAINVPHVAKLYAPNDQHAEEDEMGDNNETHSIKTEGLLYPIVQVNTRVIDYTQIEKLTIYYDDLVPEIYLEVRDDLGEIQLLDMPGLNNGIKVIIIPEVNFRYKSISLEFTITSCTISGTYVSYIGKYKLLGFNKEYTQEIVYDGCSNSIIKSNNNELLDRLNNWTTIEELEEISEELTRDEVSVNCNHEPNKQPNTWELLHNIALACQLGFCSTDNCQNVKDNLPRIMSNQKYSECIKKHISWSGTDETNIMDCWVDLYGYLVLVNVSWLLTCDVNPDNLAIDAIVGLHTTDDLNVPPQKYSLVHRTLTNFEKTESANNLIISSYNTIIDNQVLITGTSLSMYNFNLEDVGGGNNSVSQYDVEVMDDSIDGMHSEEYAMQKIMNFSIECNDRPINRQKLIRDNFFNKHRQRILEVKLTSLNLGLQRGTLVNVVIVETDKTAKKAITSSTSNLYGQQDDISGDGISLKDNNVSINEDELIEREDIPLPNMALTGMYYIDGMRFEYSSEENQIYQYLLLIKRGSTSNLNNFYTPPRLEDMSNGSTIQEEQEANASEMNQNNLAGNKEPDGPATTKITVSDRITVERYNY